MRSRASSFGRRGSPVVSEPYSEAEKHAGGQRWRPSSKLSSNRSRLHQARKCSSTSRPRSSSSSAHCGTQRCVSRLSGCLVLISAKEPNRQKANVLVDSLQPTHLAVISNILQAHFEAVGIEEKIEICAFLLQLRGRLPRWQGAHAVSLCLLSLCALSLSMVASYGHTVRPGRRRGALQLNC